jgi:hypothetical protein
MAIGFRLTDKNLLLLRPADELTLRACILANRLEASIVNATTPKGSGADMFMEMFGQ